VHMLQSHSHSQSHYHQRLFTSRDSQQEAVKATPGCVSVTIPNQVTQDITKPYLKNAETDESSTDVLYSKRTVLQTRSMCIYCVMQHRQYICAQSHQARAGKQVCVTWVYPSSMRPWRKGGMPAGSCSSSRWPLRGLNTSRHLSSPVAVLSRCPDQAPAARITPLRVTSLKGQQHSTLSLLASVMGVLIK
jgi:hypothetical protein